MTNLKKPGAFLLAALIFSIVFLSAGCQSNGTASGKEDLLSFESLNTLLGTDKEQAMETLKIDPEESPAAEVVNGKQETWTVEEAYPLNGSEAKVSILFYNDILMGFTYAFPTTEAGFLYGKEIREQAAEIYGEPSTYPTLENRLDNIKSVEDIDPDTPQYYEEWEIEAEETLTEKLLDGREIDRFTVMLELNCFQNDTAAVAFRYAAVPKSLR